MKRIDVTCGYREEYDNGEVRYFGEATFNGDCYKDLDAFNKGEGVIYIGEYSLADLENGDDATLWTKDMLLAEVRETLEREYPEEMAANEQFVEFLAAVVLETCDWQELSTYLYELTYDESIYEMFEDKKLWEVGA